MGLYISSNRAYNSTFEDAQLLTKRRRLIELNAFGIALFANNGRLVKEENFGDDEQIATAIKAKTPMNFGIQFTAIPEVDGAQVQSFQSYHNVGLQLDTLERAPSVTEGIRRLVEMDYPGRPWAETNNRLDRIPGVSEAREKAVESSWNAVNKEVIQAVPIAGDKI